MTAISKNWQAANEQRRYPLADSATAVDDNGYSFPVDLLTDLRITWPSNFGKYAFITTCSSTAAMLTLIIGAANELNDSTVTPIGYVTIQKPVTAGRLYQISPMHNSVGGFVSFGNTQSHGIYRFSNALQSLLLSRAASAYTPPPVRSIGLAGRLVSLTDVVSLVAGANLEISRQIVTIEETEYEAIVVELANNGTTNPFVAFVGPCGGRPESGTCKLPAIETIGGVGPDCDGNITIQFQNMIVADFEECTSIAAGFVIDQTVGLQDVCQPRFKFSPTGGRDLCSTEITSSSSIPGPQPSSSNSGGDDSVSSIFVPCEELPYLECFDTVPLPDVWVLASGEYLEILATNLHAIGGCSGTATVIQLSKLTARNVLYWDSCAYGYSANKVLVADLRLVPQALANPANGGILINYRNEGSTTFFAAGLDAADNTLKLWRYNGTSLITENSVPLGISINYSTWYRLVVSITELDGLIAISISVARSSNPGTTLASFVVGTALYGIGDGKHGIFSNRAAAMFSNWSIANA